MSYTTLVLGASPNPDRYSNRAVRMLRKHGHPVVAVAMRQASIDDCPIVLPQQVAPDAGIHTVSLYLGPQHQSGYYDYLLALRPQRIIFNPGTENNELARLAQQAGIETLEACTLVMLSTGTF